MKMIFATKTVTLPGLPEKDSTSVEPNINTTKPYRILEYSVAGNPYGLEVDEPPTKVVIEVVNSEDVSAFQGYAHYIEDYDG